MFVFGLARQWILVESFMYCGAPTHTAGSKKWKKLLLEYHALGMISHLPFFWIFTLVTGPLVFIPLQYEYGMYGSLLGMQKVGIGERWPAEIWVWTDRGCKYMKQKSKGQWVMSNFNH